jgi:hypothetical protein
MRMTPFPIHSRSDRPYSSLQPRRGPVVASALSSHRIRSRVSQPTPQAPAAPSAPSAVVRRGGTACLRLLVTTGMVVVAVLLSASVARAEATQVLALAGSVDQVLTNIRNWVMGILAGLATVFLSIGGVRYVMAGGDPGEVEKAKTAFKAAGIGYGLAALAPLVVTVLQGIVGA